MASEWLFPTITEEEEPSEKTRNEELFVFGYHCKLFRDDEQARMVDSGTYMIPWMGDEKLKIDRYDGRGHLYDLRPYDADNLKKQPESVLSEDDLQVEKLCDEERYLELHTDVAMKAMYEEEEWKRYYESLSEGYQAVGFSYDAYGQLQNYAESVPDESKLNPEDAVFVPAKELHVPPGLHIPNTVKENAIIEKTAKFIAEHGIQMEIVMKTKQSNNAQFQFMHFENQLHPYYQHLVKMIKSKKYIPKSPVKEEPPDALNDSAEGDGGYLHPTLMTTNRASPTPQEVFKPVPIPKVSIHETSYGQLLQSMSKVNKELAEKNREKEIKVKKEVKSEPPDSLPACVAQPVYGSSMPPPPGIEPVQLPCDLDIKEEGNSLPRTSSPPAQIVPPPPDLQPIIDRMAMYVAKNGEEFAIVVKSKKDPRFQFLETWHTHYPYYDFKRHLFQEELEREKKEQEAEERKKEQEKADILAKGVKFKLKKAIKEQESSTTLEKKPVFDYDDSGDENDDSDSNVMRSRSTNASGTSTPVRDGDAVVDRKTSEQLERKLAEHRLKDRLAASAREKLSQVDKEKQIKLERKKKAAMFINLLKSKNGDGDEESKASEQGAQAGNGRNTPVKTEDSSSTRNKSKHKTRDRSRSRDRDSRSHRSRSRSSSRSKSKKKKRHRSPTPPSAYNVSWRSSARFPPPPPPRYNDIRGRYSRSPSKGRNNRHRSRSRSKGRSAKQRSRSKSPSRTKSKKKKRSKSPKTRKDESSHRKSSKKKKKRSRSRSADKKSIKTSVQGTEQDSRVPSTSLEHGVTSPANESDCCIIEPLEEGETRESSPEPGQITDNSDFTYKDSSQRSTPVPPDIETARHKRKRSVSHDSSRSRSNSPKLLTKNSSKSRSKSKSPSKSPSLKISRESINGNQSTSPISQSMSREVTPVSYMMESMPVISENATSNDKNYSAGTESTADKNVSSYMLDRVRAIIKASHEAVHDEDSPLEDS